jgi:hypothetical protein
MASFDKPFSVIKRSVGTYVDGVWTLPDDPAPVTVMGVIQPVRPVEYEATKLDRFGRHVESAKKFYTKATLNVAGEGGFPGDIVLYNNKRFIAMGLAVYDTLGGETDHKRYWLIEEIDKEIGERPS